MRSVRSATGLGGEHTADQPRDQVEDDSFTADTPVGKFPAHNIIAKFPGSKDGIIVIASHYDTNYPLRDTSYVGANDGASSSAVLRRSAHRLSRAVWQIKMAGRLLVELVIGFLFGKT